LPREFRRLVGKVAQIYKTTYNGALTFLVVPKGLDSFKSDSDNEICETSLDTAKVAEKRRGEALAASR
jgi:hypothetical protein